jgi:hypothetical protein
MWVEARSIAKIRYEEVVKFFTDIIHRFGVPNSIIMDNSMQFTGKKFLRFYDDNHIRVDWAVVAHPCTNRQVEHANGMVLQGLKPRIFNRLNKFSGRWVAELPTVLWSLRTTPSRATGYMPFFMLYNVEAILPTDLDYGAPRVIAYKELEAKEYLEDAVDQLDEARDVALARSAGTSRRYVSTTTDGSRVEPSVSVT